MYLKAFPIRKTDYVVALLAKEEGKTCLKKEYKRVRGGALPQPQRLLNQSMIGGKRKESLKVTKKRNHSLKKILGKRRILKNRKITQKKQGARNSKDPHGDWGRKSRPSGPWVGGGWGGDLLWWEEAIQRARDLLTKKDLSILPEGGEIGVS